MGQRASVWKRTVVIVAAAVAASGGLCFAMYPIIGIPLFPPGRVGVVLLWAPLVLPLLVGPPCIVPLERTRAKLATEARERREAQACLEEMVRRDPLTGLLNRRGFFEFPLCPTGDDLLLVIIDIDDFKTVNDGAGHSVGDRVLQTVATTLLAAAGDLGCAARLGGDEFALVLPALGESEPAGLHDQLSSFTVPLPDGSTIVVAASVGQAVISSGSSLDEALARADEGMYWNKRARKRARPA